MTKVLQAGVRRVWKEAEEQQKSLTKHYRSTPPKESWSLQAVQNAFLQVTSYIALCQVLSLYQQKTSPLIHEKTRTPFVTLNRHEDEGLSVAFGPNDKFFGFGMCNGTAKVWGWGFQESIIFTI
jgi:hypothetical protein